jgi:hypothetical protein
MTFQCGVKAETVQLGHRLFMIGLGALALTLIGAVLLVLHVAVGRAFAVFAAGVVAVVLVGLWFGLAIPLVRRACAANGVPAVSPDERKVVEPNPANQM